MRALVVLAALLVCVACANTKDDADDTEELRSLLDELVKENEKNDGVKDEDKEPIHEANAETTERGLDDQLEAPYADDDDEQVTRELDENDDAEQTEEATQPLDNESEAESSDLQQTVDERSLDNLGDAETDGEESNDTELDVEDRALRTRWYGWPPIRTSRVDNYGYRSVIPTNIPVLRTGRIVQWRFYAKQKGLVTLQVWRPYRCRYGPCYRLMSCTDHYVHKACAQYRSVNIAVRSGDRIGFNIRGPAIIPYRIVRCTRSSYLYSTRKAKLRNVVRFYYMKYACRRYSFAAKLVTGTPCNGQSIVGHPPSIFSYGQLDTWSNAMYIPNPGHTIPSNGYIREWRFYAKRTCAYVYLQVFRKVKTYRYMLVGQTIYRVNTLGLNTVRTRVAVRAGYVIGMTFPGYSVIPFVGTGSCSYMQRGLYVKSPRVRVGYIYKLKPISTSLQSCRRYAFGAYLGLTHRKRELGDDEKVDNAEPEDEGSEEDWIAFV